MSQRGAEVSIWVADGGDGVFGPGDHFELVGGVLYGDDAYFHEILAVERVPAELGR